jgi:hypothetical protein
MRLATELSGGINTMNTTINKKSAISACVIVAAVAVALFAALFFQGTASAAEIVHTNIDHMEAEFDKAIQNSDEAMFSSNPYDYVKDNEYYDSIVNLGVDALPALEEMLNDSDGNGLKEYIMAIAIEDITKADVGKIEDDDLAWESAKEFAEEWAGIKESAESGIEEIISDGGMSEKEKIDELSAYGILAVPYLSELADSAELGPELSKDITALVDRYGLEQGDEDALKEYMDLG